LKTGFAEIKAQIELERKAGSLSPWGKAHMAFSWPSHWKQLALDSCSKWATNLYNSLCQLATALRKYVNIISVQIGKIVIVSVKNSISDSLDEVACYLFQPKEQ
jgi:hypothetical protein